MLEPFLGTWKLIFSEHFEDHKKELGMNSAPGESAGSIKEKVVISADGDKITIRTESIKDTAISFKLGEEFDETTTDNQKVKEYVTNTSFLIKTCEEMRKKSRLQQALVQ